MTGVRQRVLISLIVGGLAVGTVHAATLPFPPPNVEKGKVIFEQVCMPCHGINGIGDGPAAFFIGSYTSPRPRDLTTGIFKFRSTPSGELPTGQDLFSTITRGIPGFMPPFVGLTAEDRWHVVEYVKSLFPGFKEEEEVDPITIGFPSAPSIPESIQRGKTIYFQFECDSCHDPNGRGESVLFQAGKLKDGRDLPIRPTDLTNLPSFKNGASTRAIARTILTGMDGTPMPTYADAFTDQKEDVWHLVNFIRSLSEASHP